MTPPLSRRRYSAIRGGRFGRSTAGRRLAGRRTPPALPTIGSDLGFIGEGHHGPEPIWAASWAWVTSRLWPCATVVSQRRDDAKKIVETHYGKDKNAEVQGLCRFSRISANCWRSRDGCGLDRHSGPLAHHPLYLGRTRSASTLLRETSHARHCRGATVVSTR